MKEGRELYVDRISVVYFNINDRPNLSKLAYTARSLEIECQAHLKRNAIQLNGHH